ncbi:MAG: cation:proton antiporter, partial [Chromatiales bacterium]
MATTGWFLLIGALLLSVGLTFSAIRRLPFTTGIVYLAVGVAIGPTALHLFHFNPLKQSGLLEVATELAVLLSLFSAGMKMPAPVRWSRWRAPTLLAFMSMAVTVGLMSAFGYLALGLP